MTLLNIETLENTLYIRVLGILYVPRDLHLPEKETYKKTMQRCTDSYKKYSK